MNKKKKVLFQEMWQEMWIVMIFVFFIVGVGVFGLGLVEVSLGYHNFDLGHNMRYLNAEYNLDLVDLSDGVEYSPHELIDSGYYLMSEGLVLALAGLFIIIVEFISSLFLCHHSFQNGRH